MRIEIELIEEEIKRRQKGEVLKERKQKQVNKTHQDRVDILLKAINH